MLKLRSCWRGSLPLWKWKVHSQTNCKMRHNVSETPVLLRRMFWFCRTVIKDFALNTSFRMKLMKFTWAVIIKPTGCTNFVKFIFGIKFYMFRTVLCPSSGVFFHCTHSNGICHIQVCWHIPLLCVQWKTPDDGQRNCPNHAEFYSKKKFEKLMHLVGFIIRIYRDARSPERQMYMSSCKVPATADSMYYCTA